MRVFWIDEDERIWAPERSILRGLGFDVITIGDASSAWIHLQRETFQDVSLIILDVMLLRGEDELVFSAQATNDGTETGLVLAEKIISLSPALGRKILFFSRASRENIVAKTATVAERIGAHYLRKRVDTQGKGFIGWMRDHGLIGVIT
jgi:hypothetical protein